ncbi:MAG: HAMP domain-containing protein, partial [Acidimicrobiales bacterium]
ATGVRFSTTLDTELLYVAVPVASGGTIHGAVRVTLDPHEVTERVHKFWWGLAAIAAVILAVVAAVGWALARSVSRPVRRLEATAARFASGDLSPTTPDPKTPAEVASLEQAMNTMAGRLDRLLGQQRE